MFKANNKTLERRSGVFIVNFEHVSHLFLVSIIDFEQVNISWKDNQHHGNGHDLTCVSCYHALFGNYLNLLNASVALI